MTTSTVAQRTDIGEGTHPTAKRLRELAADLIATADRLDTPRTLVRRVEVDEALREMDQ